MSIFLVHCINEENNSIVSVAEVIKSGMYRNKKKKTNKKIWKIMQSAKKEVRKIDPSVVGWKDNSGIWKSTIKWYRHILAFLLCWMTPNQY